MHHTLELIVEQRDKDVHHDQRHDQAAHEEEAPRITLKVFLGDLAEHEEVLVDEGRQERHVVHLFGHVNVSPVQYVLAVCEREEQHAQDDQELFNSYEATDK